MEPEETVRRLLVARWISRKQSTACQIEGTSTIVSAIGDTLEEMMGKKAARATLRRAVTLAGREQPVLANVEVPESGLRLTGLKDELTEEKPERVHDALTTLVNRWFEVLHGLLGSAFPTMLREVKEKLLAKDASPPESGAA